jgi:predicted DNA binding protein
LCYHSARIGRNGHRRARSVRARADLFGHGVYEVDDRAVAWLTVFADTRRAVDDLVTATRESPLTDLVREFDDRGTRIARHPDPGNATCGLLVESDAADSIDGPIVSRWFIPDAPVRVVDGRELWTVLTTEPRERVEELLEELREEGDAEVRFTGISTPAVEPVDPRVELTVGQYEVLEFARGRGYYAWPRGTTAADLVADLGVSKSTVLEHLRKAEARLLDPRPGTHPSSRRAAARTETGATGDVDSSRTSRRPAGCSPELPSRSPGVQARETR